MRAAVVAMGVLAAGVPWTAAAAAVALKAVVAWVPALALGGSSLVHHRRSVVAAA